MEGLFLDNHFLDSFFLNGNASFGGGQVMTLRTPRRRISPRAKRRYRAIREFFRRALGSSSQPDIKISSTIAVNVTDLKHRIIGIEHQLNEVNKHCQDLAGLENSFRREAEHFQVAEGQYEKVSCEEQHSHSSGKQTISQGTKFLFKPEAQYLKSDSEFISTVEQQLSNKCRVLEPSVVLEDYHAQLANIKRAKKIKAHKKCSHEYDHNIAKHRISFTADNLNKYLTSSHQSASHERVAPQYEAPPSPQQRRSKHRHKDQYPIPPQHIERSDFDETRKKKRREKIKRRRGDASPSCCYHEIRNKKEKMSTTLDRDFIADIIKRQYQPVKLFERRGSNLSQFSAPVCRDLEYHRIRNDIQEGTDLCSCCYDDQQRQFSDIRSVCDTRLYSSKRCSRARGRRRHEDIYNDSTYYDVIPVKEKTSPKSRRKFVEENVFGHQYTCYPYKEVLPSPRSHRPRLNLKAQLYQDYDDLIQVKQPGQRQVPRPKNQEEYYAVLDSDNTSEVVHNSYHREQSKIQKPIKILTCAQVHQDSNNLQYPQIVHDQQHSTVNEQQVNPSLNRLQESDKTDKALCEIKDILQSFLQEIKRDSSQSQSEVCAKQINKQTSNVLPETPNCTTANNCNRYIAPAAPTAPPLPAPFVPSYPSPCCYPMMCPVNYLQNGFVVPSPSVVACHARMNATKEPPCSECLPKPKNQSTQENFESSKNNEIEDLIKEIYKYVAKDQMLSKKRVPKKYNGRNNGTVEESDRDKDLTSRSVGESMKMTQHDAKVGTPVLKSYSKSCEAIGSRINSENYYTSTQSDTVLDKLSLEVTDSSTRFSTISALRDKKKASKLVQVLKSIGILKKKKKEEGLSESESTLEVDVKPKHTQAPFRQNIMNYVMHGQEYYHRTPVPQYARPEYGQPPYDQRAYYTSIEPESGEFTPHRVHQQTILEHASSGHYQQPSAPPFPAPYEAHYAHMHRPYAPQPPLCLKEVEVKSTSTQSEKKFSFFSKRPRKGQRPATARASVFRGEHDPRNCSTQTAPFLKNNYPLTYKSHKKEKSGFFAALKHLQKGDYDDIGESPTTFGYNTHKRLAEGDMKMRNVLLKKLFYKRNPFSPRNLMVRTLLGKDKSRYGVGPPNMKTRLFF